MSRLPSPTDHKTLLAAVMIGYVALMYALGWWARGQVKTAEDFVVAGRRLPLSLAWATLLATWFGAGTLLTATDEVRAGGLQRAALDPFGAGVCLLLAGLFFAAPLWRMGLLTLPDFFGRRFGGPSEVASALLMVPSYFGWIAAQFVALASMLELFFGLPLAAGIALAAAVGTGYTLLGGMWSVTITDAVQITLVIVGLLVLGGVVLAHLGDGSGAAGLARLLHDTPAEMLRPVPRDGLAAFVGWLGVFCAGALGNIPGQDLMQRIFAARSARVARQACAVAGVLYLGVGLVPLLIGLAANLLMPEERTTAVLPALAHLFMHPALAVVFVVALLSAVLSTIDSAILSPASVIAQNLASRWRGLSLPALTLNRLAVLLVALASLVVAYLGESAYALLESAYELTLVSLFVPLAMGLFTRRGDGRAALASMGAGVGLWLAHAVLGWESFLAPWLGAAALPTSLCSALAGLAAYCVASTLCRSRSS